MKEKRARWKKIWLASKFWDEYNAVLVCCVRNMTDRKERTEIHMQMKLQCR